MTLTILFKKPIGNVCYFIFQRRYIFLVIVIGRFVRIIYRNGIFFFKNNAFIKTSWEKYNLLISKNHSRLKDERPETVKLTGKTCAGIIEKKTA